MSVSLTINGKQTTLDLPADMPLLWALRDTLGLTGTKYGCGQGLCGACTVLVDGMAVRSCITPVGDVGTANITTIETTGGKIEAALRQAWQEENVAQCGYCQAGQIMGATALLAGNPTPDDDTIDAAMSGNICRCGTYGRIRKGIKRAADILALSG